MGQVVIREKGNCQCFGDIVCGECAVGHRAFDDYHDEEINCFMKRTPRLNALMTTMKQFYRVKHSINTLNNKNNKAKRNKE